MTQLNFHFHTNWPNILKLFERSLFLNFLSFSIFKDVSDCTPLSLGHLFHQLLGVSSIAESSVGFDLPPPEKFLHGHPQLPPPCRKHRPHNLRHVARHHLQFLHVDPGLQEVVGQDEVVVVVVVVAGPWNIFFEPISDHSSLDHRQKPQVSIKSQKWGYGQKTAKNTIF